jgi:hypothetical protein
MAFDQAKKFAKSLKQRSLTDLIRAVRTVKPGLEGELISQAIAEIKNELRDPDRAVKTVAISKLIFVSNVGLTVVDSLDSFWVSVNLDSFSHRAIVEHAADLCHSPCRFKCKVMTSALQHSTSLK